MKNTLGILLSKVPPVLLMSVLALMAVVALAQSDEVLTLDIEPQEAGSALLKLGRSSGMQIMLKEGVGAEFQVEGLQGEYRFEEALAALLNNSGLTYEYAAENVVLIQQPQDSEEAEAEEPADAEEPAAAEEEEPLALRAQTVTGSRLRSNILGSPMFAITREQMKQRGFGTVEDVIRSLPQNFSTINATVGLDNSLGSIDYQGQSTVNLRGFGERSTLVLVNGRRWIQSPAIGDGVVNVNGIPFSAIQSVEVLTSGASAIYGSDARAGVINFILREEYAGGETAVRYDMGAHEGDSRRVEQSAALTWDGGRASVSLSYSEDDSVNARKAGFATLDFRPLGGSDRRIQPDDPTHTGQPGVVAYGVAFGNSIFPVVPLGTLAAGDDGTSGVLYKLSPENLVPYDKAALGYRAVTPESESLSGHVTVNQEFLSGALSAYAEFTFSYSDSWAVTGVPEISAFVPATNPYSDIPPHPFFGTAVNYVAFAEVEAGILDPLQHQSDQDSRNLTLGLRAELPFRDWIGDFSAAIGKEENSFVLIGLNEDLLAERLAGVDAAGNPLPVAQIINPFGSGTAQSAAAMDGLVAPYASDSFYSNSNVSLQDDFLLSANGSLFNMPGGEAQLALGGEYRTEEIDYSQDVSRSEIYVVNKPSRDINSYFGELSLPLVGDANRMFGAHSVGLKLALRYDEYSFSGPFDGLGLPDSKKTFDSVSPKAELAWFPMPSLKLRASWAESFVAPRVEQLFGLGFGPDNYYAVVDIEHPELGVQFPDAYFRGNPDLEPETSDTLAVGLDWTPQGLLDGLSFSVTWFDTEFRDNIQPSAFLLFFAPELAFEVPGLVVRDAAGNIERLVLFEINLGSRLSKTLDASVQYEWDTARWGSYQVGAEGTFTNLLKEAYWQGGEYFTQSGTLQGPERWKGRAYLGWTRNTATLNLAANYSSSYAVPEWAAPQTRVDNYMTFDLTGSYEFGESGWKLYGGSRNITNRKFPLVNEAYGEAPWDPRRVDTRGRIVFLEVRKAYDLF